MPKLLRKLKLTLSSSPLSADIDYGAIPSLSNEVRQKLAAARPASLGAASRMPGVTPAAVMALLRYVKRREPRKERGLERSSEQTA